MRQTILVRFFNRLVPWVSACVGLTVVVALAQAPSGTKVRGFKIAENDSQGRRLSYLSGTEAVVLQGGDYTVIQPRLITFTEKGQTNLLVMATACQFDEADRRISSAGDLRLATAGRQMLLKGTGFRADLSGPSLQVSNRVEAILRKDLEGLLVTPVGPAAVDKKGGALDTVRITSEQFDYQIEQAVFQGNVVVADPEGILRCQMLIIGFDSENGTVKSIVAEKAVQILTANFTAKSEKAVYQITKEIIRLDGNPQWQLGARSGHSRTLVFNRRIQTVDAEGDVFMRIPGGVPGEAGLFGYNPVVSTKPRSEKESSIEIHSRLFRYRPGTKDVDGKVAYEGDVKVDTRQGSLACEGLTVRIASGSEGQARRVEIGGHLVLSEGGDRLTAGGGVYDVEADRIAFTGDPEWNFTTQSGKAKNVVVMPKRGIYNAEGEVKMRFPPPTSGSSLLRPGEKPDDGTEAGTIAVACDSFEFHQATVDEVFSKAQFKGRVLLREDRGARLQAKLMTVSLNSATGSMMQVAASGGVLLETPNPNPSRFAGARMNYDATAKLITMKGDSRVNIQTRHDTNEVEASGAEAFYHLDTGRLRLSGDPILQTAQGELRGHEVVLDRSANLLQAKGRWKMSLNAKTTRELRQRVGKALEERQEGELQQR